MVIAINKSRRFRGNGNDRQSPGQMHGSARKRARQSQRQAEDTAEAQARGISVTELRSQRLQVVIDLIRRQRQQPKETALRARTVGMYPQRPWDETFLPFGR